MPWVQAAVADAVGYYKAAVALVDVDVVAIAMVAAVVVVEAEHIPDPAVVELLLAMRSRDWHLCYYLALALLTEAL